MSDKSGNWLRNWGAPSYSPTTGRAASSNGGSVKGAGNASAQIGATAGAPKAARSSGDPGRRKWADRDDSHDDGGRSDAAHPKDF